MWGSRLLRKASGHCITYREGENELRQQRQQRDCESGGPAKKPQAQERTTGEGGQPDSVLLGYDALLPYGDMLPKKNKKVKNEVFFSGRGKMESARGPQSAYIKVATYPENKGTHFIFPTRSPSQVEETSLPSLAIYV